MRAYTIVQVEVHDQRSYDLYRKDVLETIEAYGGRFLVRGGTMTVLEGSWPYPRTVIIEFPSRKDAEGWYRSPAYQKILPLRLKAAKANFIIIDGAA
jgi:uncharacterized protein (DUF1330 family)